MMVKEKTLRLLTAQMEIQLPQLKSIKNIQNSFQKRRIKHQ
jgi:hypothetical protein